MKSSIAANNVILTPAMGRLKRESLVSRFYVSDILQIAEARRAKNKETKEERRKIAQLQELENSIAELEAKLGTESQRVQRDG